jgi:hypothetical protein
MNVSWVWLFWMSLGCGFVLLLITRLFNRFTRLSNPLPEDILTLSRPLNWKSVNLTLNLDEANAELRGSDASVARRMFQFRVAASREYFRSMEHNAFLVLQGARADRRDAAKSAATKDRDRRQMLAEAPGKLEGATLMEDDSRLPEHAGEAEELRTQAAVLRFEVQALHTVIAKLGEDDRAMAVCIAEALESAGEFRSAVRLHFFKLDLLILLIRVDRLRLLPARAIVAIWHKGNDDLVRLYEQAKVKAVAYLAAYYEKEELLARI